MVEGPSTLKTNANKQTHPLNSLPECEDSSSLSFAVFVRHFILAKGLDLCPGGLHVLGHSMGGLVAGNLAAVHGEELRVRLLTLVAPAMVTPIASPCWLAICEGKFEVSLVRPSVGL